MMRIGLSYGLVLCALSACQTAPVSDRWTKGEAMQFGRSEISATVLNDEIYVAGGIGLFRTLKACEIYNPSEDDWRSCPDLPEKRHHLGLASDGEHIFAAGGYRDVWFSHEENAGLWKLQSDQWIRVSDLPHPIGEHAMFYHNGALHLLGGRSPEGDSNKFWRYDLKLGRWTRLPDMPTARHSMAIAIHQSKLWVTGGRSSDLGNEISQIEIYNFETDVWSEGPDLPVGRGGHVAAFLDGRLHVIGGERFEPSEIINRHDAFNLETDTWSEETCPLSPRHGAALVAYGSTLIKIGGGSSPGRATIYSASKTVQKFR